MASKPRVRVRGDTGQSVTTRDYSLANPSPAMSVIFGGSPSNTGRPITPMGALQSTTVWGCVKAIAEDMAKIPVVLKERQAGGYWTDVEEHSLLPLLFRPNEWMTWFELVRYVVSSLCLRGNALIVIKRGWDGQPEALIPLQWDRVAVVMSPRGWLYYHVSHPTIGWGVTLHQDDVIHIRGQTFDGGYIGVSPISAAADAVGLSIATQEHGAVLFRQGAQVHGILKFPQGQTLTDGAKERLRDEWRALYGGVQNSHRIAVLEDGLAYEKIQMTQEEAQFLGTRQFQVVEVCRMFRVPPHKVFDLSRATFSNIEASEQAYINDTLTPLAVNIEQLMRINMLPQWDWSRFRFEFVFDALLRGDRKSRYEAHKIGADTGILTVNEIRGFEGMAPKPGGDELRVPLNTAPIQAGPAGLADVAAAQSTVHEDAQMGEMPGDFFDLTRHPEALNA